METKKPELMPSTLDTVMAKKLRQTPRLTCETEANDAQKIFSPFDAGPFGPSSVS
jgi:hypothetical protein